MNWSKELVLVDFIPLNLISLLPCALQISLNLPPTYLLWKWPQTTDFAKPQKSVWKMWLDSLFSQNNEEAILSSPKNGDDIFLWLLLPRMTKKEKKII